MLEETDHKISLLPQGKKKATKLAKRDVARAHTPPEEGSPMKKTKEQQKTIETAMAEEMSDYEPAFPMSRESREITPIETNIESDREIPSVEASNYDEEHCCSKTKQHEETRNTSTKVKEAKVAEPAETSFPREKTSRRRPPTQRYGIDLVMAVEDRKEETSGKDKMKRKEKKPKQ